jgi:23S rRNA pseudouridine1911/1915/1917 synthase
MEFRVEDSEAGERADAVLARRTGVARSVARDAIAAGEITINERRVKPGERLAPGDLVAGDVADPRATPPEAEDIPLDVKHDDHRVLVVSKPPGLVVHPAGGHPSGTLVNALLGLGEPLGMLYPERPGLVHRLDRETSGLLLVAKDDEAQEFLMDALKRREVKRRYLALVRGRPPAGAGTIDAPIGRHPARPQLMAVVPSGKPAVTHYEVLQGGSAEPAGRPDLPTATDRTPGETSLLDVRLETGRTHQIRVHMAHISHPVLGDRFYGGVSDLSRRLGLKRPFLHAYRLTFPHPDGGRIEVTDALPEDLEAALARARGGSFESG